MDVIGAGASGVADLELILSVKVIQLMPLSFAHHPSGCVEILEISSALSLCIAVGEKKGDAGKGEQEKQVLAKGHEPVSPGACGW